LLHRDVARRRQPHVAIWQASRSALHAVAMHDSHASPGWLHASAQAPYPALHWQRMTFEIAGPTSSQLFTMQP
jgi:hypothetical protein